MEDHIWLVLTTEENVKIYRRYFANKSCVVGLDMITTTNMSSEGNFVFYPHLLPIFRHNPDIQPIF